MFPQAALPLPPPVPRLLRVGEGQLCLPRCQPQPGAGTAVPGRGLSSCSEPPLWTCSAASLPSSKTLPPVPKAPGPGRGHLSSPWTSLRCLAPWAHLPQSSRSEKGGGPRMPPPPCPGDQAGVGTRIPPPGWSSDQPPTTGSFSSPPPAIPASLLQLGGGESVGIAQGNPSSLSVSAPSGTNGKTEAQGK